MKTAYIECSCLSNDHVLAIRQDEFSKERDYEPFLTIEYQLNMNFGFFERVLIAIKYIFGFNIKNWDCTLLNIESASKIDDAIQEYKRNHKEYCDKSKGICTNCDGQGGVSSCNECGKCAACKSINEHTRTCPLRPTFLGWDINGEPLDVL